LRARYSIGHGGFYLDPDDGQERTCRTCFGSGKEPISPELRGKVLAELAGFVAPRLKATDVSSTDGSLSPRGQSVIGFTSGTGFLGTSPCPRARPPGPDLLSQENIRL